MTRWAAITLVGLGGTLGTLAREGVGALLPEGDLPWSILAVNAVGAVAIGVLLEGLAAGSGDGVPHRGWRLFLGTGFLGGLTTYSALAVGTDAVARSGRPALALAYALGSVLIGLLGCWAGEEAARCGVRLWRGPRPLPSVDGAEP